VAQPEELAESLAMVLIEMGDTHGIEVVAIRLGEIAPQLGGQVAPAIVLVIGAPHVRVIDEDLAAIDEVEAERVGIAKGEEMDFRGHWGRLQQIVDGGSPVS
jgi:hypothetical protein